MAVDACPLATRPLHPCRSAEEPEVIARDLERDGVAVVRGMLHDDLRERLLAQVEAALGSLTPPGGTAIDQAFIERSPALQELLLDPRFLRVARAVVGARDLVVNRSAAILRRPGSPQVLWHSDHDFGSARPTTVDAVLNRGEWPGGLWFYLTGCSPGHGGLAVVRGSHRDDWRPPAPWRVSADRHLLLDGAGVPAPMAIADLIPVQAAAGDLVVFAARTYHAAYAMDAGDGRPRLSCGLSLRPRGSAIQSPWRLPAASTAFLRKLPPQLATMFEAYTGLDPGWRGE